jgi:hypothetical protein
MIGNTALTTAASDKDIPEAALFVFVSWVTTGSLVVVVAFGDTVGFAVVLTTVVLGVAVGSLEVAGVVHGSLVLVVGACVYLHPTLGNTQPQAPV